MNFWVITLGVGLVVCGAAGVLGNMVPFVISKGFTAAKGAWFYLLSPRAVSAAKD